MIHRCVVLNATLRLVSSLLLFVQTVVDVYLPVFRFTAAVDFIQQPVQTGFAQLLKFPPIAVVVISEIRIDDFRQVMRLL